MDLVNIPYSIAYRKSNYHEMRGTTKSKSLQRNLQEHGRLRSHWKGHPAYWVRIHHSSKILGLRREFEAHLVLSPRYPFILDISVI